MATTPERPGYAGPYRFSYPVGWIQVGVVAVALGTFFASNALATWFRADGASVTMDLWFLVAAAVVFPVTVVIHEGIHALVAKGLGYRVSFGFDASIPAVYAGTLQQWIQRRHNALVAASPVLVLTPVGAVAILLVPAAVVAVPVVLLVSNSAVAVADLYLLYRLARLPAGSLLYDESLEEMLIYEPTPADADVAPSRRSRP